PRTVAPWSRAAPAPTRERRPRSPSARDYRPPPQHARSILAFPYARIYYARMTHTFRYTDSTETDVSPSAIWSLYEDVETWPCWDAPAERVTRDGPFATGSRGTMKLHGQDPLHYRLTKV